MLSYLFAGIEAFGARDELDKVFVLALLAADVLACETGGFAGKFAVLGGGGSEDGALLVGAFVALFGEVSELLCSDLGVVVFLVKYWSSLIFFFAVAEPLVTLRVLTSGSGLSRKYLPVYSGRSSSVVYSKQKHGMFGWCGHCR